MVQQTTLGKHGDALDQANSLTELRDAVVEVARACIDLNAVSFVPIVPGTAFGEHAAFSHDEFSDDFMRKTTLEMMPITERDTGGVAKLFALGERVLDLNAVLRPNELERTEVFNEYWRPYRLERQLLVLFRSGKVPLGWLALARSARQTPFREADVDRLDEIRLRSRKPLAQQIQRAREPLDALPLALAQSLPEAAVLFDARGQILWASKVAERQLALRAGDIGWFAPLQSVTARAWRSIALETIVSKTPAPQLDDLLVRRIEISPGVPVALVSRRGSKQLRDERIALASQRQQLTPREAEVLLLLGAGLSNKELANELGCNLRTVETHVSKILRKFHVTSRAQLLALL